MSARRRFTATELRDAYAKGERDFNRAILERGADLRCADLRCAYLSGADLRGADLSGADLSGAPLNEELPKIKLLGPVAQAERLAYLMEECAEVIQICGKILRHGYESCDPTAERKIANRHLLERELSHVRGAEALMSDSGDVDADRIGWHYSHGVSDYLHHQDEEL